LEVAPASLLRLESVRSVCVGYKWDLFITQHEANRGVIRVALGSDELGVQGRVVRDTVVRMGWVIERTDDTAIEQSLGVVGENLESHAIPDVVCRSEPVASLFLRVRKRGRRV
jgi:hypothetical protein